MMGRVGQVSPNQTSTSYRSQANSFVHVISGNHMQETSSDGATSAFGSSTNLGRYRTGLRDEEMKGIRIGRDREYRAVVYMVRQGTKHVGSGRVRIWAAAVRTGREIVVALVDDAGRMENGTADGSNFSPFAVTRQGPVEPLPKLSKHGTDGGAQ